MEYKSNYSVSKTSFLKIYNINSSDWKKSAAARKSTVIKTEDELEAASNNLSITTFRYAPKDLLKASADENYLNKLNETLLNKLQRSGKVFLSNAVIDNKYCLRVCIVNFRTGVEHLQALVKIVLGEGKKIDAQLRSSIYRTELKSKQRK